MSKSSENIRGPKTMARSDVLSPQCLEKSGLAENPFTSHAKAPLIFVDKQLEESINGLVEHLQNQNSTVILVGEAGVGKTTHLRMLLREGRQKFNFCTIRARLSTSFAEIEKKIQERWQLPAALKQDAGHPIQSHEYVKRYIEAGNHPVLLIDDAQRLQDQVLDATLQLKHRVGLQSSQVLGLVLSAESNIQKQLSTLEQTHAATAPTYQVTVQKFDVTRCEKYISYRLKQAGAAHTDLFSRKQLKKFYVSSKGLPGIINTLACATLAARCRQPSRRPVTARLGSILAGLIGLAFIAGVLINKPQEAVAPDTGKSVLEPAAEPEIEASATVEDEASPVSAPKKATQPYATLAAPLAPLQTNGATDTNSKQAETIAAKQPLSSRWLLTQDPEAYTIQIASSQNREYLFVLAKKHLNNKPNAYYQSRTKTWFILVYGIFPSHEEALAVIETLPAELRKYSPHPLQLNKIQQVIRQ